ncbi:Two-component response regulator, YesN/AraC family, consists of REC and AraC-type DNA-binding domains [Alkalispirochaeta americana]|uniref:Two-component response regulator, YesN/AraC family, consists of REC and AraC-type DNA-binding domains n=1 Tax=Alkalispirochaeta americana TaxID=159291 RepID=A0A1N6U5T2_9SPIO|nr:response regulator [Alkalispirochaeta americana]SIQ60666.1 Two-component response regulator, YesN/AraC family, consists of REC and AraC-type DNA-binding domains [Alkalispirochaeta americana]
MGKPYRMVLVDDEDEIRSRIASHISPESGFTVAGTAGNGYDALELIEQLAPDVVLTDIKMPYIDGIELASILRRDYPAIRIGFISGYNDFDYARQAVQLQVRSYLMKPLTREDILAFLGELKTELDQEFASRYSQETMQRQYQESLPLLAEKALAELLTSPRTEQALITQSLQQYGVDLDDTNYAVALIRIERSEEHWDILEFEKAKLGVRNNISHNLDVHEIDHYSCSFQEDLVFLLKENRTAFLQEIDAILYQTIRKVEHFLSIRIFLGLSRLTSGYSQLRGAYNEAARAYSTGRMHNLSLVMYSPQADSPTPAQPLLLPEEEQQELQQAFRFGDTRKIEAAFTGLRDRVATLRRDQTPHRLGASFHAPPKDILLVRFLMLGITHTLIDYARTVDVDIRTVAPEDILETLLRMQSFEEYLQWVKRTAESIRQKSQSSRLDSGEELLAHVITYLKQNFSDNQMTMQTVCAACGISISYLSQLFRKYQATTFVRYLTKLRMEHAREQLLLSGSRVVEVAEACGYRDIYYFSHCFKRHTGLPPKAYREKNL